MSRYFLILILILSLLIRIIRFDFPLSYTFAWGDGTRDFLIANHILRFHEFPYVGPFNLLNDVGIFNSPIYFYVLSLFLIPFNNILTLSLVNIFLQIGVIVLIYKITKKIFDYPTALIAILLFSFNPEIIKQADFVWQPYLAYPVALLGLYLNTSRPYVSLSLISFATILHYSAFPWLPLFCARIPRSSTAGMNARKNLSRIVRDTPLLAAGRVSFLFRQKSYVKNLFIAFSTLAIFYLPLIVFYIKNGFFNTFNGLPIYARSPTGYFSNLTLNIRQLLNAFYLNNVLIFFLIIGFFITLKKNSKRKSLIFIFLLFISPIIFASFFNKIRLHYLILSLGMLPILVASITGIFKPFLRTVIVLLLIVVFSGNFAYSKEAKNPLDNQKKIDKITSDVVEELNKVKKTEGFSDFDFFQVASFSVSEVIIPYPVLDTFLLVPLEKRLDRKLAQISDISPYNHFQINKREYLLVSCFKFTKDGQDCSGYFKSNFPDFNILKMIYNDQSISIYLAKHEQI